MTSGKKIFGAFMIAIVLFLAWPAMMGTWQQVSALRQTVAERENLLARRQEILASVATAYQQYTTKLTQQDGQKFSALVPVRKNQAELLSALGEIATSSGATLGELRVSETVAKESAQFKTMGLTMDLTGSYRSLRTFLTGLEQYVRLLNVDSIQASVDPRTPGQLKFSIKANAYFLK